MYFEKLPLIYYSLDNKTTRIVKDITVRTKIAEYLKGAGFLYEKYIVRDGERPEHIAAKFYKDPTIHWLIMLTNEVVDPINDWPISEYDLQKWVEENMDPYAAHHYVDANGNWVNSTHPKAIRVTNLEHHQTENDKKRVINLIKPDLIQIFIDEFDRLVKV